MQFCRISIAKPTSQKKAIDLRLIEHIIRSVSVQLNQSIQAKAYGSTDIVPHCRVHEKSKDKHKGRKGLRQ